MASNGMTNTTPTDLQARMDAAFVVGIPLYLPSGMTRVTKPIQIPNKRIKADRV